MYPLADSFLRQLEEKGAVTCPYVEQGERFRLCILVAVLVKNVGHCFLLYILAEPNFSIVAIILKVLQFHLEGSIPMLLPRKLGLFAGVPPVLHRWCPWLLHLHIVARAEIWNTGHICSVCLHH